MFIRMRWVSIRWTPLLSIPSTSVILRRVSFSLFALLFSCNFHEIKLTFSFFCCCCLKMWKILGMIEIKTQWKRKKNENQYCFYIYFWLPFCYIHAFIQYLNTYKGFMSLFLNLLAFVSIFNAAYFKCSIWCTLLYTYLFNTFLHNQFRGRKFCHFRNLKYI